jgi:hypothetical protein
MPTLLCGMCGLVHPPQCWLVHERVRCIRHCQGTASNITVNRESCIVPVHIGTGLTVAKELPGHEDIKTTMVYAKADTRPIRDGIRSFDVLERSGYTMVTKGGSGTRQLLKKHSTSATDESITT